MHSIKEMLDDCNELLDVMKSCFSEWERKFLRSISQQFEEKETLTERQSETLYTIWNKVMEE